MQANQTKMLLAGVGFACFLAMNSFSLWGFTLLPQTTLGADAVTWWTMPLSYGNALSFLIFVFGAYKAPKLFNRNPLAAAVAFLALALILLSGHLVLNALPLLALAGLCMGLGTTCCFFCWARVFRQDGASTAKLEIVLGSVLSAVPFIAFITLDPSAIAFTLGLLAFFNLLALFTHGRLLSHAPSDEPTTNTSHVVETTSKENASHRPFPTGAIEPLHTILSRSWKAFLCIGMIGLMSPIISALTQDPNNAAGFTQQAMLVHSENISAAILLGIAWFGLKRNVNIISSFTLLFPVLATALLVFSFMGENARIVVPYVGGVSFVVISMVVTIESVSESIDRNSNITIIYGLNAGLLYCANQVGTILADILGKGLLLEGTSIIGVMFALLYGCSIVLFFITRNGKHSTPTGSESQTEPTEVNMVDATCQKIVETYAFSERQAEVFTYLAHGYDIPTIAKKLFLSENTVRTHAKKVYATLDVHSKQEIIELVHQPHEQ